VEAAKLLLQRVPEKDVDFFFFERKNELRPQYQETSFFEDARKLHQLINGEAYRFGDEDAHHINVYQAGRCQNPPADDTTLEILMHGIPESVGKHFSKKEGCTLETIAQNTQVHSIFEDFEIDDYLFDPVGYSLNGLRNNKYYTIHVTPQKLGSYISFETNNCTLKTAPMITQKVIEIFQPYSFDVLFFSPKEQDIVFPVDYVRQRYIQQTMPCGYNIHFRNFVRPQEDVSSAFKLEI
jgi:S-adenosylmethionine decarboxylase